MQLRLSHNIFILTPPRPELAELLSIVSSHPDKLLLCLDDQHITFPVRTGQHCQQQEADSGFDDGLSVLFPYFKEDLPFDPNSLDGFEEYWTIQFSGEPWHFICVLVVDLFHIFWMFRDSFPGILCFPSLHRGKSNSLNLQDKLIKLTLIF